MSDKTELLTRKEAAELLSCSPKFITRLERQGLLPCLALGSHYRRFRRADIEALINKKTKMRGGQNHDTQEKDMG